MTPRSNRIARIREAAAAFMEPFRFLAAARALREFSRHFPRF